MTAQDIEATRRQRRIVVTSTLIGSTIEWYDFFIFGTLSALYINTLFFPAFDTVTGRLLSFMTFATAWIARPIGGVIAGHIGDRIGRKTTLYWSLIIMGLSTTLTGLLPTYQTAGAVAPLLLVLLRICQGLSVGGEFGGAVVALVEHADEKRKGLFGMLSQLGTLFGLLLGNATFLIMSALDQDVVLAWGWRVPFLLSVGMLAVGAFVRSKMEESPDFERMRLSVGIAEKPLAIVLRRYPRQFWSVLFAQAAPNTFFYTCVVFVVSYGVSTAGFSHTQMLGAVCFGAVVEACMLPVFGMLTDRLGRRRVFVGGLLFLAVAALPFFYAIQTHSYPLLLAGYVAIMGIGHASALAAAPSLFAEMFPPRVRFSGLSAAYQSSGALLAGPLPIVATVLISVWGGSLWLFAGYTIVIALVSTVAILLGLPHFSLLPPDGDDETDAPPFTQVAPHTAAPRA